MLTKAGETYIIFDALDESERYSGSYSSKSLLDWIKSVHDESINIHILVTSRPEQDIMASFNGWVRNDKIIQLQSELVSDDITAYTKARVSEIARWKERSDIQAEIETTLLEKANGMYVVLSDVPCLYSSNSSVSDSAAKFIIGSAGSRANLTHWNNV
jgi:hypothetical protein